ncbi:hypothetical protein ACXR2U_01805 [Jatrophihabitans sp. YIM 134969]
MTSLDDIEALRARNPEAADLAALCAVAVVVEPHLLRLLRLLLPKADVAAETDLWSSPLAGSASVNGFSLRADAVHELSRQLRLPRFDGLRERALDLVDSAHANSGWSVRLSEQLARVGLGDAPDDRARELVLASVNQLTSHATTQRERTGIARWLLSVLARLPPDAVTGDAAQAAACAATLQLGGRVPETDPVVEDRWLPYLLAATTETVPVAVQFGSGRLDVNRGADTVLALPRTDPLVLDVDWTDDTGPRSTRLRFAEGERSGLAVAAGGVDVRTLAGVGVRLSDPTAPSGRDGGFDFGAQWARHPVCLGRDEDLRRLRSAAVDARHQLILGGPGTGKTTLACAFARSQVESGARVISHFFGVVASWDDPELVRASLVAQTIGFDLHDRVLVLLDDLPVDSVPAARALIDGVTSGLAPDLRVVATGRIGTRDRGGRDLLTMQTDDGAARVCSAMIEVAVNALPVGTRIVDRSTLSIFASENPGRLQRLLDWIRTQPGPDIDVEDAPPTLIPGFDERVDGLGGGSRPREWLTDVAVAGPGFTVADLAQIALLESIVALPEVLAAAASSGLVHLDGAAQGADGCWLPTPLRGAPGLADALAGPLASGTADSLARAHQRHAAAAAFSLRNDGGPSRYQLGSGVAHALAAERAGQQVGEQRSFWRSATFLHGRAGQDGVAAAVADLAAIAHWPGFAPVADAARSVVTALGEVPSEQFADAVINELRRREGEGWAGRLRPAWPPPLAVRSATPVPAPNEFHRGAADSVLTTGTGSWLERGAVTFADGRAPLPVPATVDAAMLAAGEGFAAVVGVPRGVSPTPPDRGIGTDATRLVVLRAPRTGADELVITPLDDPPTSSDAGVTAVAFSHLDTVAVGRLDGTIELLMGDGATASSVAALREPVLALAFRADGRSLLAVDGKGHAVLIDLTSGGTTPWASADTSDVQAATISPDGERAVLVTAEGRVQLFEGGRPDGEPLLMPDQPSEALAFAPDSDTVAVGSGSSVMIFDARAGRALNMIKVGWQVSAVAMSAGGLLAIGRIDGAIQLQSVSDGEVRANTVSTGAPVSDPSLRIGPHYRVRALAFSPDGTLLATVVGDLVTLYAVPDGAQLTRLTHPSPVLAIAFSPDGAVLLIGGADGTVRTFGLSRESKPPPTTYDLGAPASCVGVVAGTVVVGGRDGVVTCVSPGDRSEPVSRLTGHRAAVTSVGAAPGARVATASEDGTVRVWSPGGWGPTHVLRHRGPVRLLTTTGLHLVSADATGEVRWWSAAPGSKPVPLAPPFAHAAAATALVSLLDGTVVSCAADGSIVASSVGRGQQVTTEHWVTSGSGVRLAVAVGELVATWHDDGLLRWWATGRGYGAVAVPRGVQALVVEGVLPPSVRVVHDGGTSIVFAPPTGAGDDDNAALRCLAVDDPGGAIAVGAPSGVWRSESTGHGEWTRTTSTPPRALAFVGGGLVTVLPDGSNTWEDSTRGWSELLAMASDSTNGGGVAVSAAEVRRLDRFDPSQGPRFPVGNLLGRGEQPTAVAMSPDGETVAVGTDHGRVVVLDGQGTLSADATLGPAPVTALAAHGSGFVIGTQDGAVLRWASHATAPVPVGRHDDQVEGLTTVAGRVLAASADGTLRLWDADHGTELGRLVHTTGFTAVASIPGAGARAYARTADGLLWLLDVEGFEFEPLARDVLQVEALPGRPALLVEPQPEQTSVRLGVQLTSAVGFEVRRITVTVDRPERPRSTVVSLDSRAEFAEPLDVDGRLLTPYRHSADSGPVDLHVWLAFPPMTDDRRPWVVTVDLEVVTRARADPLPFEITVTARPAADASPFQSLPESASLSSEPGDEPVTVTYRGQEGPDDVDTRITAGPTPRRTPRRIDPDAARRAK